MALSWFPQLRSRAEDMLRILAGLFVLPAVTKFVVALLAVGGPRL